MRIARLAGLLSGIVCLAVLGSGLLVGCGSSGNQPVALGLPAGPATAGQVAAGRTLVMAGGCGDCHNRGKVDPTDANWLAGFIGPAGGSGGGTFNIGPFQTYADNLTPHATAGLGGVSDRQVFNAMRFGLDPEDTPDVVITSTTPGVGNHPATPVYLAPPMPWPAFRHFADEDLWAIVAYLKHGLRPNANVVPPSAAPPDNWASSYEVADIGVWPAAGFPTASEQFVP
ncbi:MAG: hypothetical protein IT204_15510 [Fimbriimonadaceae bacterium]|nr:hypothetical protein [Fimbriimonadaceae bacterium]